MPATGVVVVGVMLFSVVVINRLSLVQRIEGASLRIPTILQGLLLEGRICWQSAWRAVRQPQHKP